MPQLVGISAAHGSPPLAIEEFVDVNLLERVPFMFDDQLQYLTWRRAGAGYLDVDPRNVIVVGSAAHGFSITSGSAFGPESDVDVAVISEPHFNQAWSFMRHAKIGLLKATQFQKEHLRDHAATSVYHGCVATDFILPLMPFGGVWQRGASALAQSLPGGVRQINFRLYRDVEALRSYQIYSHKKLQKNWERHASAVS